MLNSMASTDFEESLVRHVLWNIKMLDLRDGIFGKGIADLTLEEARRALDLIKKHNLSVYCLSTGLFHGDIEIGEDKFGSANMVKLSHVIKIAEILHPKMIRLLACQTSKRQEIVDSVKYIKSKHSWLFGLYYQAIQQIHDAGFHATIENEIGNCIFSRPEEITGFFHELDLKEKACLTWDVQNLWQMGIFPTMDSYNMLKELIGYFHLKGGQNKEGSNILYWSSALEDASWPVEEITGQVVKDGISPVICLNPSHGKPKENYDYTNIVKRDLDFLRKSVPGVE
ncbi:xylose isomerase [Candidatus Poribacteria bacterium]|nr:xylose isomerase [Candidatus Poribacteria bacterium]